MPNMAEYCQQLKHLKVDIDKIPDILESVSSIKKWCYIIHDKDIDPKTKEPKEPHIHIEMNFGNTNRTYEDIAKWFKDEPQYVRRIGYNQPETARWNRVVLYLIHGGENDKKLGKTPYNIEDIRSNYSFELDIENAKKKEEEKNKYMRIDEYIDKLISGEISFTEPELYLSNNDIVKYRNDIKAAYNEYARRKINKKKYMGGYSVNVIFITGSGGSGKDVMATTFAEKQGNGSYYVSSSSNDVMQDYAGENTLIFSDLRDDIFSLQDLLKILDNHLPSSIKSRYSNKYFVGDNIIITSAVPLKEWYRHQHNKEDMNQLYRRITTYIEIDDTNGEVRQYQCYKIADEYEKYRKYSHLTMFPMEHIQKEKYRYALIDTSPYSIIQALINLKKAQEEKNIPLMCDVMRTSIDYLQSKYEEHKEEIDKKLKEEGSNI